MILLNDGKFQYDDFEKKIIRINQECNVILLPEYQSRVEDCREHNDEFRCLNEVLLDYFLDHHLNVSITNLERTWLLDNPEVLCDLNEVSNEFPALDMDYVIEIIAGNYDVNLEHLIHGAKLWGPDNNYITESWPVICNAIESTSIPSSRPTLNSRLIGLTPSRNNVNDLQSGYSGDITGITNDVINKTMEEHLTNMKDLIKFFSVGWGARICWTRND
ncbi:MAG: hypothetical protein HOP11_08905 [Saprospiraceae bacterium]|nr:hypothetical protein [Saprospiraceae bacterium]